MVQRTHMDSNLSGTSPVSSAKLKFAFSFRTQSSAVLLLSSTVGCTVTGKPLFYILTVLFWSVFFLSFCPIQRIGKEILIKGLAKKTRQEHILPCKEAHNEKASIRKRNLAKHGLARFILH